MKTVKLQVPDGPEESRRFREIPTEVCDHFGGEWVCVKPLGERRCEPCGDGNAIKVFACAVYGECQLGDKLPGVASCANCPSKR